MIREFGAGLHLLAVAAVGLADELTRNLLEPAYSALDEPEGDDLLRGLADMKSLLPVPELPE